MNQSFTPILHDNHDGKMSVSEELDAALKAAIEDLEAYNNCCSKRVLEFSGQTANTGDYLSERLQLVLQIGRGNNEVWECVDWKLRRLVAVKRTVALPAEVAERTVEEMRRHTSILHPNVGAVLDAFSNKSGTYIVMERLSRDNLRQRLQSFAKQGLPVPPVQALEIIDGVLEGLAALHGSGTLHLDLKPANICMGRGGVVKLIDFSDRKGTGTDGWQAPEQTSGDPVDERTDLFSAGIVTAALLGAVHPFVDPRHVFLPSELIREHAPRGLEHLPPSLQPWIERMLQKNPEERFSGAAEALVALREANTLGAGRTLLSL